MTHARELVPLLGHELGVDGASKETTELANDVVLVEGVELLVLQSLRRGMNEKPSR